MFFNPSLVISIHLQLFEYRISLIDGTLSGFTSPGKSGPGNNGNEEKLYTSLMKNTKSLFFISGVK